MIRSALALIALLVAIFAHEAHASPKRSIASVGNARTTNSAESAPLSFVDRAFVSIKKSLAPSFEAERLTYKLHVASTPALRQLLVNINGGPSEVSISSLDEIANPGQLSPVLDGFLNHLEFSVDDDHANALENHLEGALKSVLTARADVKLFAAELTTHSQAVHVLMLRDEETSEILILDLARTN